MWFWEAAPIITYTTGVILGSNFRYQIQEVNYRMLIKCARENILHRNLFEIMSQWNKIKFKTIIYSLMELELKIPCACHQAKIAICCQKPLVAPIAPKICTGEFFSILNPNLPSDLLSDHSSNASFKVYSLKFSLKPLSWASETNNSFWEFRRHKNTINKYDSYDHTGHQYLVSKFKTITKRLSFLDVCSCVRLGCTVNQRMMRHRVRTMARVRQLHTNWLVVFIQHVVVVRVSVAIVRLLKYDFFIFMRRWDSRVKTHSTIAASEA